MSNRSLGITTDAGVTADTTIAYTAQISGDKFLQDLMKLEVYVQSYGLQIQAAGRAGKLSEGSYAVHAAKYNNLRSALHGLEKAVHASIASQIANFSVATTGTSTLSKAAAGYLSYYGAEAIVAMMPEPEMLPAAPATLAELTATPLQGLRGGPLVVPVWAAILIGILVLIVIIAVAVVFSGDAVKQLVAQQNTLAAYMACLKANRTPEECRGNIPNFFEGTTPWWTWVLVGGAVVITAWFGYKVYRGTKGATEPQRWSLPAGTSGYNLEV